MSFQNRLTVPGEGSVLSKKFAVEAAEKQQDAIDEQCKRLKEDPPSYRLLELIGKGAYGRVYKSRNVLTNHVVAVKILDTEALDAATPGEAQGINDTLKEIEILRQLKRNNTVNVNPLVDAFGVLSSLWIVSEYCPGGSLTTLRRAIPRNQIDEQYIRAIARELALALKSVHEAGIVHRDVKCSNVMIHENGNLQLIDFGVAGLLRTNMEEDKRTTIIGTPHWMPPEMQKDVKEVRHSFEVDVWAYGITIYECAMGAPPNRQKIGRQLRQAIRNSPPRLNPDTFPEDLCDLISFACEIDPRNRPTMAQICEHKYNKDTAETYPTSMLQDLVVRFYNWQNQGNQRTSILDPNSADALKFAEGDDGDEWNFSTTDKFEKRMSGVPDGFDPSFRFPRGEDDEESWDEETAKRGMLNLPEETESQASNTSEEVRAARGKKAMQGIFDNTFPTYKYTWGKSDLPFRTGDGSSSFHHKELSVNSNNGQPTISLNDPPKQAKRDTQNWTFADNQPPPLPETKPREEASSSFQFPPSSDFPPSRPPLKHAATMPVGPVERPMTLDLDALMGSGVSGTGQNVGDVFNSGFNTSASSLPSFNQETLIHEPPDSFEADMADIRTMRPSMYEVTQLDLDAGFAEFDHPDPSSTPFGLGANGFPTFPTGLGSEPYASQLSTRLPSPEPTGIVDMNLPISPPPASPPLIAPTQNPPPVNALNGMFTEWANDHRHNAIWYPRAPRPESMAPDANFEVMLEEHNFQCRQLMGAIENLENSLDHYQSSDDDYDKDGADDNDDEDHIDVEDEDEGYEISSIEGGLGESDGEVEESD